MKNKIILYDEMRERERKLVIEQITQSDGHIMTKLNGKVYAKKLDRNGSVYYQRTIFGGIKGRDGIIRRTQKVCRLYTFKKGV